MNDCTLENFISYCDDMQIAEEKSLFGKLEHYSSNSLKQKASATKHRKPRLTHKNTLTKKESIHNKKAIYQDKFEYNEERPPLTDEDMKLVNLKLIPQYKKLLAELKVHMNSVNKEFNLTNYKFTSVDVTKLWTIKYYETIREYVISVSSYPFGFNNVFGVYNKPEEQKNVSEAFNKFEDGAQEIVNKYSGDVEFIACKHNTDYPDYCNEWDRWFYWVFYEMRIPK